MILTPLSRSPRPRLRDFRCIMIDTIRVSHGCVLLVIMWEVIFGLYTIEGADEPGLVPPPGAVTAQQKSMRGRLIDTRHSWVHFDAYMQHAVTPVTSGRRVSAACYVLKGWETLGPDLLEDLGELGFPLPEQTATSLNPAVATVELKPAEVQTLPGDDLTDLTYDEVAASGSGEHLDSNIQGSDGTPIPLTPSQVELLREHVRSGHLKKSHLCKPCVEAEGPVRRHVSHSKKRTGVGHIGICGPMPLSWEDHRYVLVLGLRLLDDAPLLISARGLAT